MTRARGPSNSSPGFGWYAVLPPGVDAAGDSEGVIVRMWLVVDEYDGPFYYEDDWGFVASFGPDFDELQLSLGISRDLYDDVMAWHREVTTHPPKAVSSDLLRQKHVLESRLRSETPDDVLVGEDPT